ncbi:Serine/threonine-protein kinase PknB [Planctomycetes bacterium Pan216]|uniref:Serine/threonine-protein kinase PknB n=1 Tax=Kolteria novifilia TaxID=2527975 RepID=A0A518B1I0_9BACT|nr:Serine/threonine-protein kinase PknB [Planctomycetes bacterium Pan216]
MSADEYRRLVLKSELVSPEDLERVCRDIDDLKRQDAEDLAERLVRHGLLTEWQARQIHTSRGRRLVIDHRYRLLDKLGEGGMGAVFAARDTITKRTVALKIPRPDKVSRNPNTLKRFRREAVANARLEHPNIVRALRIGTDGRLHYIAFELVAGEDFEELVTRLGVVSAEQATDYIAQAADGLACIHRHGVIHRDLKPSNLLVTPEGEVKILDLGFARLTGGHEGDGSDGTALTKTGILVGTLDYMAPEQAEDTRQADIRSDIYGLGCTFYELLAGHPPFEADSDFDMLMKHVNDPIVPIEGLDPSLMAILAKMLAKKPADRYATPDELHDALRGWQRRIGFDSTDVTVASPVIRPRASREGRRVESHDLPEWLGEPRFDLSAFRPPEQRWRHARALVIALAGAVLIASLVGGWHWLGRTTMTFEWPEHQRKNVAMIVDGESVPVPEKGPIEIDGSWGFRVIRLHRPGYELVVYRWFLERGEVRSTVPEWIPTPRTVRRNGLEQLTREVAAIRETPATSAQLDDLRTRLNQFVSKWARTNESLKAAELFSLLPSPLDAVTTTTDAVSSFLSPETKVVGLLEVPAKQLGHWAPVGAVAFNLQGDRVATAGADGMIKLWDVESRTLLRQWPSEEESVEQLLFFDDNQHLVSVSASSRARVWRLLTGELIADLGEGVGAVAAGASEGELIVAEVARSEDNERAADRPFEGAVVVLDWQTNAPKRELLPPVPGGYRAVAISPDRTVVAAAADSGGIVVVELRSGKPRSLRAEGEVVDALAFSLHASWLVGIGGDGRTLSVWERRDGTKVNSGKIPKGATTSLGSGGDRFAVSSRAGTYVVGRFPRANDVETRGTDFGEIAAIQLSLDGRHIALGTRDHLVEIADSDQTAAAPVPIAGVRQCVFARDARHMLTLDLGGRLRHWSVPSGEEFDPIDPGYRANLLTAARLAPLIAFANDQGEISLLDTSTWLLPERFPVKGDVVSMALTDDGTRLAAGTRQGAILLWNLGLEGITPARTIRLKKGIHASDLTFSPSGDILATAIAPHDAGSMVDGSVLLWDPETGENWGRLEGQGDPMTRVVFSPSDRVLTALDAEGRIYTWDAESGNLMWSTDEGQPPANALDFHPTGKTLVTSNDRGAVHLWDARVGVLKATHRVGPPGGIVADVAFSPSGNYVATGNGDGTVYFLHVPTTEASD